ncbi:MAG: cytochrome c oxidase subunit II [Phycisphaerales bacterium]|nr:cytochrome c oxidase subunit II [Phycisphaerales bacterium]
MTIYLIIAVVLLVFVITFQVAKASEYVSILRGEEANRKQNNKINGWLMIIFLILGLWGAYICNNLLFKKTLLAYPSASVQGDKVDEMIWITLAITGFVFIVTQILLFYFAWRYQESDKRKVFFFSHSNKLEFIWTAIPALVLTVLIVFGLKNWFYFTGEAPKDAMEVEVTGKQFGWIFRYPGVPGHFGKKYYKMIDLANNPLGLCWRDSAAIQIKDDPYAHKDVVLEQTMYLIKNKPVKLIIGSRDVLHDVGLSQFRLKMDAVPGIPTTMWLTPKYTTEEMKKITNNPDFEYEISCDQMCGNGHYSMKGIIKVLTQEEYDAWWAKQKPAYLLAFPIDTSNTKVTMIDNKQQHLFTKN